MPWSGEREQDRSDDSATMAAAKTRQVVIRKPTIAHTRSPICIPISLRQPYPAGRCTCNSCASTDGYLGGGELPAEQDYWPAKCCTKVAVVSKECEALRWRSAESVHLAAAAALICRYNLSLHTHRAWLALLLLNTQWNRPSIGARRILRFVAAPTLVAVRRQCPPPSAVSNIPSRRHSENHRRFTLFFIAERIGAIIALWNSCGRVRRIVMQAAVVGCIESLQSRPRIDNKSGDTQ